MASITSTRTSTAPASSIVHPIPIYRLASRYFLYDIDHITYLRATHNIPGVLIGSLPQSPQQNVFLGLPLQLMPEEARLLVEQGVAFIVDDAKAHREGLKALDKVDKNRWRYLLRDQGLQVARAQDAFAREKTAKALNRMDDDRRKQAERSLKEKQEKQTPANGEASSDVADEENVRAGSLTQSSQDVSVDDTTEEGDSLFESSHDESSTRASSQTPEPLQTWSTKQVAPYPITPTTSYPLLSLPSASTSSLPVVNPGTYPIYAHLHSLSYFLSPGLRFGCHYMAYPGDPLRFHSHFLVEGHEWDEEFDLLDIVGGGRLGTGVKKGFLIGGKTPDENQNTLSEPGNVRCFSIEWGGM